jgi:hypothetical protein
MIVEKQMKCRLAGETEVLGENLSQRHFCTSQNPTWPDPGLNAGRRGGKPATNRTIVQLVADVPSGPSLFEFKKSTIGQYPEPDEHSPQPNVLFRIYFNNIL